MPERDDPNRLLYPGFTGRIMVDTWRGKVRVRKWPRKRGRPKSPNVRAQNDWFRDANKLASRAPDTQAKVAIEITKNSGLYPRDILMRAMAGNLGPIPLADGTVLTKATKRIEPVTFQGARTELAASQVMPANTNVLMIWGLPVFDPLGFWSPGAPSRLTIPNNVSVVRLTAGFQNTGGGLHFMRFRLNKNGASIAGLEAGWAFSDLGTLDSGPTWVVPGDYFEATINANAAGTLVQSPASFLALEILTAV